MNNLNTTICAFAKMLKDDESISTADRRRNWIVKLKDVEDFLSSRQWVLMQDQPNTKPVLYVKYKR